MPAIRTKKATSKPPAKSSDSGRSATPVLKKAKPKAAERTRPRVESSEPKEKTAKKNATHRGVATALNHGELEIYVQLSELAPVAQYANVTIGPVSLRYVTHNPGIEELGVVNWDDDEDLTDEQQEIYDTVRGWLRATSAILEHHIADDRELVETSVAKHNEREASESKQKSGSRRKPKS